MYIDDMKKAVGRERIQAADQEPPNAMTKRSSPSTTTPRVLNRADLVYTQGGLGSIKPPPPPQQGPGG